MFRTNVRHALKKIQLVYPELKLDLTADGMTVHPSAQLRHATALASVVVFTQYISNLDQKLYHHAGRLWLMVPVLLLWLLASRGQLDEDPVVYAITDNDPSCSCRRRCRRPGSPLDSLWIY